MNTDNGISQAAREAAAKIAFEALFKEPAKRSKAEKTALELILGSATVAQIGGKQAA